MEEKLIFIVDDDPIINRLVINKFASDNFRVEAFENGEDCLRAIDKSPDLIILDYFFINEQGQCFMNGMEILDKIKLTNPDLPVIMLSGQEKGEIVLELARKGIYDYIIKDSNLIENLDIAINEVFSGN